jgi:nucleoside-diphosphate-sugar epimerase
VGVELVRLLTASPDVGYVRVIDTSLPQLVYLSAEYKSCYDHVDYRQANVTQPAALAACFAHSVPFDVVYNCSTLVKADQVQAYYEGHLMQASLGIARACVEHNVLLVHLGTGLFYRMESDYRERDETTPFSTDVSLRAQHWNRLDAALRALPGLRAVIVRPARMYGPTDTSVLGGNLCVVYLASRAGIETPIALDSEMRVDTVHTHDVARAMVHLAKWYKAQGKTGVEAFNVADEGKYRMKDHVRTLNDIFPYKAVFVAPPNTVPTIEEVEANRNYLNELLIAAWLDVRAECKHAATPLSP